MAEKDELLDVFAGEWSGGFRYACTPLSINIITTSILMITTQIFIDASNPHRTLTWSQYASTVKCLAVGLQDLGVCPHDCVAIVSRNDIYYYVLGNGVTAARGVFAPVSAFAKPVEMEHQLRVTCARWIFVEPEFLDDVVAAAEKVGIPKCKVLIFDAVEETTRDGFGTFSQLLKSDESRYKVPETSDENPCERYLTSGSTGLPKAAEMSHRAMIARVTPYLSFPKPIHAAENRQLHFIDMHHISGWFNNTFTAIGKQQYHVTRQTDAASIVDTIQRFEIHQIMMHPRMVEEVVTLIQKGARDCSALASLRQVRVAGSQVRGDYLDQLMGFLQEGAHAFISYGATEISTMAATMPGVERVNGYVGKPPKGMEVIIVDPETLKELPHDTDGEICARSAGMFTGYVNNEEATKKALVEICGKIFLRTGDRGHWSSTLQQLAITGRYKETFKVGTEEVAPEEIEALLLTSPGIADVAVTSTEARPGQGGLEPLAYVIATQESMSAQEIVNFVADSLAAYKAPTGGVVFSESIPRTSFGKIQRAKLAALVQEEGVRIDEGKSRRFLTPSTTTVEGLNGS